MKEKKGDREGGWKVKREEKHQAIVRHNLVPRNSSLFSTYTIHIS